MKRLEISITDAFKIYDKNGGYIEADCFEEFYLGTFDSEEAFTRWMLERDHPELYKQLEVANMLTYFDWEKYLDTLIDKGYDYVGTTKQVWIFDPDND